MSHWHTLSGPCTLATSGDVSGEGAVPPSTGSPSACSSFLPRIRL